MAAKPVIAILGASGNIGKATVKTLSAKHADKFDIRAGVRNPDKASDLTNLPGVTVFQAEMGNSKLKQSLSGVDALYIVTPGAQDRAQLTISTAQFAKEAGVKFILVVSATTIELADTVFGGQMNEVEIEIPKLGVSYCFLRLPLFMENIFGFKDSIQGQSAIYCPVDPQKPFTNVAVEDAGNASAAILVDYAKHANLAYTLISDRFTYEELAELFTSSLGRKINYVQVPNSAAKEAFIGMGMQEWQVNGLIELFDLINAGAPETNYKDMTAYKTITGEEPTTITKWISKYGAAFNN